MNRLVLLDIPDGGNNTPRKVSNLFGWYAADRIIGQVNGNSITTWSDLSGSGNNLTQPTSTKRPTYRTNILNGKPILRFDGTDDCLQLTGIPTLPNACTFFIVGTQNNQANGSGFFEYSNGSTNSGTSMFKNGAGALDTIYRVVSAGNKDSLSVPFPLLPKTAVWSGLYSASSGNNAVFQNGVAPLTTGAPTTFTNTLNQLFVGVLGNGTTFPLNGDLAEVIIYTKRLSTTERALIENYLIHKWGISTM